MADKPLSTVLYIDTDLGYLADSRIEPPLPIVFFVINKYWMKFTYIIILFFLAFSCRNPNSTRKHSFTLIDRDSLLLGVIICKLPSDFDTTYTWLNSSDCDCCDAIMYRSHSSNYEVITESGFLSMTHLDSGFYFTISHYPGIDCDTSREYVDNRPSPSKTHKQRIEEYIKYMESSGSRINITIDTSRIINKNFYDIFSYTSDNIYKILAEDSSKTETVTFNVVTASTVYKNRSIGFNIQSNVHQRDSFNIIAMNILKSVHIE